MPNELILVTRHEGAVEWLRRKGLEPTRVLSHIYNPSQIAGKNVVGTLPLHLVLLPRLFGRIVMDYQTGEHVPNYTWQEMEALNARILWYRIHTMTTEEAIRQLEYRREFA